PYADDVVITSEWNSGDLDNIIRVLHAFHLASCLKINIHKSNIYGIGVSNDELSLMASRTGCVAGSFPSTYLALPTGSNMNLTSSWNILVECFQKRLSSCKANLLSIGGRLALIKAVLGSLDIQYLSIFKAPEVAALVLIYGKIYGLTIPLFIFDTTSFIDWNKTKTVLSLIVLSTVNGTGTGLGVILAFETWLTNIRHVIESKLLPSMLPVTTWEKTLSQSAGHIFFECDLVKKVWLLVRKWCDIHFPPFASYDVWKIWICSCHAPKEKSHRLYVIFAASF
ncbi:hypothetical protein Tco_1445413, partial [Tanacetum coccineum]